MRIILRQDVPNLGSLGDEVTVKDGYARNYLLPRGMAIVSGWRNASEIAHQRKYLELARAEAVESAQQKSAEVQNLDLVVMANVGPGGRLFGSVTNRDLQALLAEKGVDVDRKSITLHEQVRSVGTFTATVRLHTEVKVELEFRVEGKPTEEELARAAEAEAEAAAAEQAAAEAEGEAEAAGEVETVSDAEAAVPEARQKNVEPGATSAAPEAE